MQIEHNKPVVVPSLAYGVPQSAAEFLHLGHSVWRESAAAEGTVAAPRLPLLHDCHSQGAAAGSRKKLLRQWIPEINAAGSWLEILQATFIDITWWGPPTRT